MMVRQPADLPVRIGPAEFTALGALIAVRCPRDLDPLMRKAGGVWEPGGKRWLIEPRRMKPLVTVDWAVKENVRAKLRVEVRRLLRRYGYPPDLQQMAIDLVMEQANVVCEKWVDT